MILRTILMLIGMASLCQAEEKQEYRFPVGDIEEGKAAFVRLACNQCHTVRHNSVKPGKALSENLHIKLAEEKRFVTNYGNLITAITNPQHLADKKYSKLFAELYPKGTISSAMPSMIDDMSARDLMNLVQFLDSLYQKMDNYGRSKKTTTSTK